MMLNIKKNKKGIEAGGFNIIIGIIILLISAGVILFVILGSASKVGGKTNIETCRGSNVAVVATRQQILTESLSSPRICSTITLDSEVPTKTYKEEYEHDNKAAAYEVSDMIKNCWYMWLEGSNGDVFPREWGGRAIGNGCFVCYIFNIKEGALDYEYLTGVMNKRVYSAVDTSNGCADFGGGFLKPTCGSDEKETSSKKTNSGDKCCIKKDYMDECGNKGGICSTNSEGDYYFEYDKWRCPGGKTCYVKEQITYMGYLEKGSRGGYLDSRVTESPVTESPAVGGISINNPIAITFHSYGREDDQTFIRISSLENAQKEENLLGWFGKDDCLRK